MRAKMEHLQQGDHIEHWENGIGKILEITEDTITVDFKFSGKLTVPARNATSLKKLLPTGLWANLYENEQDVRNLIKDESLEIIKLLIYDEHPQNDKINRTRIKLLLTKSKESTWRSNFYLIDESNWK